MLAYLNASADAHAVSTRVDSCLKSSLDDSSADGWPCSKKWLKKIDVGYIHIASPACITQEVLSNAMRPQYLRSASQT